MARLKGALDNYLRNRGSQEGKDVNLDSVFELSPKRSSRISPPLIKNFSSPQARKSKLKDIFKDPINSNFNVPLRPVKEEAESCNFSKEDGSVRESIHEKMPNLNKAIPNKHLLSDLKH